MGLMFNATGWAGYIQRKIGLRAGVVRISLAIRQLRVIMRKYPLGVFRSVRSEIGGIMASTPSPALLQNVDNARQQVMTSDFFALCYLMLCQLSYANENDGNQAVAQITTS